MTTKSLLHSSLLDNQYYTSMLVGNEAYEPSDEDILAETILTGTQAGVTFTSVDTLASGYKHLQLRTVLRSNRADVSSRARIRFNSDTGANYINHYMGGTGTTTFSSYLSQYTTQIINVNSVTAATQNSGAFGVAVYDIYDAFETTKYKTVRFLDGQNGAFNRVSLNGGTWKNTAAITSIAIEDEHGSFISGSRFTLIGLK